MMNCHKVFLRSLVIDYLVLNDNSQLKVLDTLVTDHFQN